MSGNFSARARQQLWRSCAVRGGGGVANGGEHPDFIFIFHNGQILVENNDIEDMIFEFFFLEDKKSYYFRFVFYTI